MASSAATLAGLPFKHEAYAATCECSSIAVQGVCDQHLQSAARSHINGAQVVGYACLQGLLLGVDQLQSALHDPS